LHFVDPVFQISWVFGRLRLFGFVHHVTVVAS
jgi:hypothetical protein